MCVAFRRHNLDSDFVRIYSIIDEHAGVRKEISVLVEILQDLRAHRRRHETEIDEARKEIAVLTDALHDLREQAQGRIAELEAKLEEWRIGIAAPPLPKPMSEIK
jgi:chromosome segregation ATPase